MTKIKVITPDVLDDWVRNADHPVLLVFLRKNEEYLEEIRDLKMLFNRLNGKLIICLGDEYYTRAFFKRFGFGGTPLYILMENGQEKGRFFGKASLTELEHFIRNK